MSENHALWKLCERQDGVLSQGQLIDAGLSRHSIAHRVDRGRLWPRHRGVYAVGRPQLSKEGVRRAALLAVGPDAVLCGPTAADHWGLQPEPSGRPTHVLVPSYATRPRHKGVVVHRSATLRPNDITHESGFPVTTTDRTAIDLALTLDDRGMTAFLREGEYRRLLDLPALRRSLEGSGHAPAPGRLRRILDEWVPGIGFTESELEARFMETCARGRLSLPAPQQRIWGKRVDFYWADVLLIVEVDGYEAHRGRIAFQNDRSRDRALKAAGYEVLRFTWAEVVRKPREVAAELIEARARRAREVGAAELLS